MVGLNEHQLKCYYIINDSSFIFPHMIKVSSARKSELFKYVCDYDTIHMYNSLISNILLNPLIEEHNKIYHTAFILYYFWFMNPHMNSIEQVTRAVCCDFEAMIKIIIDKEMTIYKDFNTNQAVTILRDRLRSERILISYNSNINFRK